jgi:hypothetical protein
VIQDALVSHPDRSVTGQADTRTPRGLSLGLFSPRTPPFGLPAVAAQTPQHAIIAFAPHDHLISNRHLNHAISPGCQGLGDRQSASGAPNK